MKLNAVLTGLLWLDTKQLPKDKLESIKEQYSYVHPYEPTSIFQTFYETKGRLGIPYGNKEKASRILSELIEIVDDRVLPAFSSDSKFIGFDLRDYQEEAFKLIMEYLDAGGTEFNLAGKAGSGKSFMLSYLLSKLGIKTLIIAHLSMLTDQLYEELHANLQADIRILNKDNMELGDINVATSQFISKRPELWKKIKYEIGIIVVDEAESVASETTLRILQRAHAKIRIFISATFSRSMDGRTEALTDMAGKHMVVLERKDLLKPTVIGVDCPEVFNAPQNPRFFKRAQTSFFKHALTIDLKVLMIASASLKKGRQLLVVTDIIEMQERYAHLLNSRGVTTGILNGTTKVKVRKEILAKYNTGEIQVLIGAAVLNAGISVPKISVIVRVSFTNSHEKLEQLIGRSLRDYAGKQGAWFIDLQFTQGVWKREQLYRKAGFKYRKVTWQQFERGL